jgi:two-component system phosphate regulon response regulator PhoB
MQCAWVVPLQSLRQTHADPDDALPPSDDPDGPRGAAAPPLRVLVIEGDADQRVFLGRNLQTWGHEVALAESGDAGLRALAAFPADLVLVDLTLPDLPGAELCRRLRRRRPEDQPVVFFMLSARGDELDDLGGCDAGPDDYLVKPFSLRELRLRVSTRLRRRALEPPRPAPSAAVAAERGRAPRRLTLGPLAVDPAGYRAYVNGREVLLSATEIRLLLYFFRAPGALCLRRALLTDVWGYRPGVSSRTVDVFIKRLRDKLGPAGSLIQTVRGLGYRFADPDSALAAVP